MAGLSAVPLFMLQIPGLEAPDLTFGEQMAQLWRDGGWMMWPLGTFALIGLIVIVWKLIHLTSKSSQMKKFLTEADTLIGQGKIDSVLTPLSEVQFTELSGACQRINDYDDKRDQLGTGAAGEGAMDEEFGVAVVFDEQEDDEQADDDDEDEESDYELKEDADEEDKAKVRSI